MTKTFYVNQTNGNDDNDGSSNTPFKSLQKAIESIPPGGIGVINLQSDYILDSASEVLNIENKKIYFLGGNKTYNLTINQNLDNHVIRGNGILIFTLFNSITVNHNIDTSKPIFWPTFRYLGEASPRLLNIQLLNTNKVKLVDNSGTTTTKFLAFSDLRFAVVTIEVTSSNVKILNTSGNTCRFEVVAASIVDSNGNTLSWSDAINGIVRDANGVPRNIISNIVL